MWREVELSVGEHTCELGSLSAARVEFIRHGIFDSRTGKRTWAFRASLDEEQRARVEIFRCRAGRDALVRLRAEMPSAYEPYLRMQLDGCRLTLDGCELRLEDPDTTQGESWMWKQ